MDFVKYFLSHQDWILWILRISLYLYRFQDQTSCYQGLWLLSSGLRVGWEAGERLTLLGFRCSVSGEDFILFLLPEKVDKML